MPRETALPKIFRPTLFKPDTARVHRNFVPTANLLEQLRHNLGATPRKLGFFTRWGYRVRAPKWMSRSDQLSEIYRQQTFLLNHGSVVWGVLVQANMNLFAPGNEDHPAAVIHGMQPTYDDKLEILLAAARRMYRLKNTVPDDPTEQPLAAHITDEMSRTPRWHVPEQLGFGPDMYLATIMVMRSRLPGRHLVGNWLPMLVHPKTSVTLSVPLKYWPAEMSSVWLGKD